MKNSEIWAPAFFKHNNSFIATVKYLHRLNFADNLPVSLPFVGGKTGKNPALSTLPLVSTSPAKRQDIFKANYVFLVSIFL